MTTLQHGYHLGITPSMLVSATAGKDKELFTLALNHISRSLNFNEFFLEFAKAILGVSVETIEDYVALLKSFWPVDDGDMVNQHLKDTLSFSGSRSIYPEVRTLLVTGDGTFLSIQAGYKFASSSNSVIGPFTDVEVQSHCLPLPDVDTEDFGKEGDIYFHYPTDALNRLIVAHGGTSAEFTKRVEAWMIQFGLEYDHKSGPFEGREVTFSQFLLERHEGVKRRSDEIAAGTF